MALDYLRKSGAIIEALKIINPDISGQEEIDITAFWDMMCYEDIKEIVDNAAVSTDVIVNKVTGVLPGGGVSGPGDGSGSGTIT